MAPAWKARKLSKIVAVLAAVLLCLIYYSFSYSTSSNVDIDRLLKSPIVHGQHVSAPDIDLGALQPYVSSPQTWPSALSSTEVPKPWLIVVTSHAKDARRRQLLRSTWMRLYQRFPFDARFVVSNAGPEWNRDLQAENRTFGDLIVLDHLQEDDFTACTIKAFELFKWLIKQGPTYEFVTKTETDVWFNIPQFWDRYLSPRLSNDTGRAVATVENTMLGILWYVREGLVIPYGPSYTMTWDLVQDLAALHDRYNVVYGEDVAVTMLMRKGNKTAQFVNLGGDEIFNYDECDTRGDDTAWARTGSYGKARSHALGSQSVVVAHELKSEVSFLKVADCFDEQGLKPVPPLQVSGETTTAAARMHDLLYWTGVGTRFMTAFERIPNELFTYEDGEWICDGVWKLGPHGRGD